ncbi:MAG: tRNA dihydrouridine synthase DusB [Pseudomonadota bacterium]
MSIGPYQFERPLALAPMAGVTDRPFRLLCRRLGADLAASEMVTSDTRLWHTTKSRLRLDHTGEPSPRIVQIAGGEPEMMVEAARRNRDLGAQIIDINMGCPAKKVCNRAAGSALLRDEPLVAAILAAVVAAVDIPVTLKMRTGWDRANRNGPRVARLAEEVGIAALAIHGRTRADHYEGEAEYETIRAIKDAVRIPVFANGDIDCGAKAAAVLAATGADGIMIGRGAQGRPWIFREIRAFLEGSSAVAPPDTTEVRDIMTGHLEQLYAFYGEHAGLRVARKHLGWYRDTALNEIGVAHDTTTIGEDTLFRAIRTVETAANQLTLMHEWLATISARTSPLRLKSEPAPMMPPQSESRRTTMG